MKLVINGKNIHKYRSSTCLSPDITSIRWAAGPLDADVLSNFPNLEALNCNSMEITSLKALYACPQLKVLHCAANHLTSLEGLKACLQLQILRCNDNRLTSLRGVENCNELITLEGIFDCNQLELLDCGTNQLMTLSGLENCTQLKELNCEDNYLAVLDPLVYLRRLERLQYSGNPLNIQTVQVQRFLNRFNRAYYRPNIFSVYTNRQSVHDEHIQKTVCDSVQNLLKDPKPTFSIETLINTGLDERTLRLLFEYCGDETVHSHHLLTYCELLGYVWARISRSEHRSELIKILGEQILDAECMCFTGRFNRTLSVMVGFYPDIIIEISDNSRIGAIIMTTNSKIKPYDPVLHRALAHKLLTEAGYDEDTIDPWLGAISEL